MLVFDKNIFGSNREIDSNGYLRVSDCSITKTQVSPYLAQEIPNWKDFGLERDKIYYVLRPEAELKKAVETFNNLPLTRKHIEVDVDNVPKEDIIGSLGDSAVFEDGYLKNNLIVYDQKYIDRIENGKQKELSCGYRYTPVRESGEYNGQHYDFVMKDIIGNHVALVKEGRAGHDVMVSDTIEAVKDKIMGLFGKKQIVGDETRINGQFEDDEDVEWITVRGTHIPIKKGEDKGMAVENYFKNLKDAEQGIKNAFERINKTLKEGSESKKKESSEKEKQDKTIWKNKNGSWAEEFNDGSIVMFNKEGSKIGETKKNPDTKKYMNAMGYFDKEESPSSEKQKTLKRRAYFKEFVSGDIIGTPDGKVEIETYNDVGFTGRNGKTYRWEDVEETDKKYMEESSKETTNDEIPDELDKPDTAGEVKADKEDKKMDKEEKKESVAEVKEEKVVEDKAVDKRKLIDEIGGILKGKVDDELIRTIIGKAEQIAYNGSEAGKADDEAKKEEIKEEVKEKEVVEDKCGKMAKDEMTFDVDSIKAKVREEVMADFKAREEARKSVKSTLGEINVMAFDSCEEIYKLACEKAGLNLNEIASYKDAFKGFSAGKAFKGGLAMDATPNSSGNEECFKNIRV